MMRNSLIPSLIAAIVPVFLSCSKFQEPANTVPTILSPNLVSAIEDTPFAFIPEFTDNDGPDTIITYENHPSWLSVADDSLFGTPLDGTPDSSFTVIVSDGLDEVSKHITLAVTPVNDPPVITSPDTISATSGVYFYYDIVVEDPDDGLHPFGVEGLPSWLEALTGAVKGTPPDGAVDTGFTLIVSDGQLSDTLVVSIRMIPPLVVYGDTRTGHDVHQQIVDLIRLQRPSAVFHVGDLVNDGLLQDDWDIFNSITADMRAEAEFYPAAGNHEAQSQLYFDNFELPGNEQWYAVDKNGVHFIILNSNVAIGPGSEQYQWLESELAVVDDSIDFVAVVLHHPPYSTGTHTEDEMGLRDTIVPLFEQYGVDIVFTGHDHDYERSYCGGIYYMVTGGGGAPLRDQTRNHPCSELYLKSYEYCKLSVINNRLTTRVYDNVGALIDSLTITQ